MKKETLFEAVAALDGDLIEDYVLTSEALTAQKKQSRRPSWRAVGAVAACLALVIGLGAWLVPMLSEPDSPDSDAGDIMHAVEFGNYLYRPLDSLSCSVEISDDKFFSAVGEKLKGLCAFDGKSVTEYSITESDLGEYIGIFPAVPAFGDPEGKAYHLAVYPDYDSLIIVDYGDRYRIFISDGIGLSARENATDSTNLLALYGLPETFKSLSVGSIGDLQGKTGDEITSIEVFDELYFLIAGKDFTDWADIAQVEWEAWCAIYGDERVKFDRENGFSYQDPDAQWEFAEFTNERGYNIYTSTTNGFEVIVSLNAGFNYFYFENRFFTLTEAETEAIVELLGLE